MKILQLKLMAFGPFTDELLELGEGNEGLHIIYGLNEAGKSSALRALCQMLYGIPDRSSDNFRHPYSKMRIGAVLQKTDGTRIELVRRKGRINTLRGGDDKEPLDESLFKSFLGNVDGDVFATMFGIDHADLVQGGQALIQGGGDVGQALFAAGSGISNLQKVRMALQAEAEALFTPAASKKPINEAIREIKKNQKEIREAQLPGQEWQKHDEALQGAERVRGELGLKLAEKQAELHRLSRIKEALPLVGYRNNLLEELNTYADAVLLPEDFGERLRQLLTDLRIAETNGDQARNALKDVEKSMQGLSVSAVILESADQTEHLYKELGSHQKAVRDRIQIQTQKEVLWREAGEILSGLRDDITLEEVEKLRPKKSETVKIQKLGAQYERLMAMRKSSREEIERLALHNARIKEELKVLQKPATVDDLMAATDRALKYGVLEDHYQLEQTEIHRSQMSLEADLKKQAFWSGSLEGLENLPLPSIETIDTFDTQLQEAEKGISQYRSEIETSESLSIEIGGQIRELELEQEVPTEEDLQASRIHREKGWGLVRRFLDGGEAPQQEVQHFLAPFEQAETLADAYEHTVQRADEISDRLRREADRVAKKAKLLADQETRKIQLKRLKKHLEGAEVQLNKIREAWSKVWESAGISPRTPREMRAWVQNQGIIIEKFSKLRERISKADELKAHIELHRGELDRCFNSISETSAEEKENLSELIKRSQKAIERNKTIRNKREQLLKEKKQREQELKDLELRVEQIESEISQWQTQWEEAIRPLGLEGDAIPEQANAIMDDLKDLFEKLKDAQLLQKRVQGIDRDAKEFSRKVINLTGRVAQDLKKLPVEQVVTELNVRLTGSRTTESKLQTLEKQRNKEGKKLSDAEGSIAGIRTRLAAMCDEAGCSDHDKLSEAEDRSKKRREIASALRESEERLLRLSAGSTTEGFVKEIQQVDPDGIDGQMARLGEEIEALEEERSQIDQTIGEERNELGRMDGSSRAADLAEETQRMMAQLEGDVEKYARLRISSTVLAMAIERYREKHQGPVLKRANELFCHLTVGSFEGIQVDFDNQGNPVLVGVRSNGKDIVGVEGMSDGTTDQLYLALRLASLETYLDNNESMPFIVDDIMIKFDDERAATALQALAELSKKTQVIFFTHHQHLVELADSNVESSVLFKHTMQS